MPADGGAFCVMGKIALCITGKCALCHTLKRLGFHKLQGFSDRALRTAGDVTTVGEPRRSLSARRKKLDGS